MEDEKGRKVYSIQLCENCVEYGYGCWKYREAEGGQQCNDFVRDVNG